MTCLSKPGFRPGVYLRHDRETRETATMTSIWTMLAGAAAIGLGLAAPHAAVAQAVGQTTTPTVALPTIPSAPFATGPTSATSSPFGVKRMRTERRSDRERSWKM